MPRIDWPPPDGAHLRFDLVQVAQLDCRATVPALAWGVVGASLVTEGVAPGWEAEIPLAYAGDIRLYRGAWRDPVSRSSYDLELALYPPVFLSFDEAPIGDARFQMVVTSATARCVDDYRGGIKLWGEP
jgi:hypothetical protein